MRPRFTPFRESFQSYSHLENRLHDGRDGERSRRAATGLDFKHQVWVEPRFAKARACHVLRRLRLHGLLNANIQGLLIAGRPRRAVS